MKKNFMKLVVLMLVAIFAISAVGCKNKNETSKLDEIKSNQKLVIGTSPDYPPFEFLVSENGEAKIVGADIELAKKIAEKIGIKLEIKAIDFEALLPALQSGQVDMVITGMTPSEERKKSVDFSDIYFTGKNGVIVRAEDSDKIKSEEDLKTIKLGAQKGSVQEVYIKEQLGVSDFKSLVSVPDLIMDLKNGNIDAVILNDKVAGINETKYEGVKALTDIVLTVSGEDESMAIAVKKGNNQDFINIMNEVIKEVNQNGEYEKILADAVDMITE